MRFWKRMRSHRRLLRPGWALLIAWVPIWAAALNTGLNLFYIVVGGLGSLFVISMVLPGLSVRRLRVTRDAPYAAHRGETFGVTVRIENHKRFVPSVSLRVEWSERSDGFSAYVPRIAPQRAAILRMTGVFERRGVHPLPPMDFVSAFPFGCYERRFRIRDATEVVVYPRVMAIRAAALERLPGPRDAPRVAQGTGDEFFSLRDYVRGDDLRRVAWKVSARRGNLVVREMARETTRFVVFVLDTALAAQTIDRFEERFEESIELAASLAVTLLSQQYTVSVVAPRARVESGQGRPHIQKILDLLARITPDPDPAVRDFAWFVPKDEAARASYVFLSPDPETWGRRNAYGAVVDPREVTRA